MKVHQFPDRLITVEGEEYLYFGGTSYLGIATNKNFNEILSKELHNWGAFYGSSRNSNIQLTIYDEFEQYFSNLIGVENSLSVSSGTLAGKFVIEHLSSEKHTFFHYPKTHPAILEKNSLPLFLNDKLNPKIFTCKHIVITLDAVLGGEVTVTNLGFLNKIPKEIHLTLVVDESHSLGILGDNGNGIFSSIEHDNIDRKIMVSSLGKAIGLAGGIIASDKNFIDDIKQNSMFVSSSGMSPAYLAAFLKSEEIYKLQKEKLKDNLAFLSKKMDIKNFLFNPKYPVIYANCEDVFKKLLQQEIIITSFKYPTYKKTMNRIVITADHTIADLEKLLLAIQKKR